MQKIIDKEKRKVEMLIGKFLTSGFNLWTEQQIDETLKIESRMLGKKVMLVIDKEGEYIVNTADINSSDRSACISMSQILNLIVKQAMSETGMIQIGRFPRFFDHERPLIVPQMKIQIWKGFKFSAYKYSDSCALILDDCCRFMSTESCLDRINSIYDYIESQGNNDLTKTF